MGLRKVQEGERWRPSASLHNATIDAIQGVAELRQQLAGGADVDRINPAVVPVYNATGGSVDRFAVLAVTGVRFTPTQNAAQFKNIPVLNGETPIAGNEGQFAILLSPAASGAIVEACVAGVVAVQIDMISEAHQYADITAAQNSYLTSAAAGGAQILYVQSGTGTKWAYVRIGSTESVTFTVFELKETLAAGGTAVAYVRDWDATAEDDVTDTSRTITAWDYIGDRTGTGRDDAGTGGTGAIGLGMRFRGETQYRIVDLQCP